MSQITLNKETKAALMHTDELFQVAFGVCSILQEFSVEFCMFARIDKVAGDDTISVMQLSGVTTRTIKIQNWQMEKFNLRERWGIYMMVEMRRAHKTVQTELFFNDIIRPIRYARVAVTQETSFLLPLEKEDNVVTVVESRPWQQGTLTRGNLMFKNPQACHNPNAAFIHLMRS